MPAAVTAAAEPEGFTDEERALFAKLNIGSPGGLPLPSFIRPSEVVAQARPLAVSIFADYEALQKLVQPHEALLLDKWKNLKKKKRRDILVEAWAASARAVAPRDGRTDPEAGTPGSQSTVLPTAHRPDLVAWRRREREKQSELTSSGDDLASAKAVASSSPDLVKLLAWTDDDRAAFLWPNVNLADLAHKTRSLWRLARARARLGPHAFAAADLDTTRLGKACLALLPRYLNQYSMLFAGRTTPEAYGQLFTWDELEAAKPPTPEAPQNGPKNADGSTTTFPAPDSFDARGTHPGEGLWILTIQARLYRFLQLAVGAILGSNGAKSEPTAAAPVDDAYGLPPAEHDDLPAQSLEAPYGPPPAGLDLQALLNLTYAKVGEAEDHVWALRTDPAYLAAALTAWAEHRKERLAPKEDPAPSSSSDTPAEVTPTIVDACLRRALEQVESWHLVYAKVRLVATQMENHAAALAAAQQNPAGAALPRDVVLAFFSLGYHLRSFENEPVGLLQQGAFASPPLRRFFRRETEGEGDKEKLVVVPADGEHAPPDMDDENTDGDNNGSGGNAAQQATAAVIWAVAGLEDDATRQLLGRQTLLDELETATRQSREAAAAAATAPPQAAPAVTPWVADQVATLAIYAHAARLLDRFQPWAGAYEQTLQQDKDVRDILGMDFHLSMNRLRPLLEHPLTLSPPEFVGAADSEDADRRNLAEFWWRAQHHLEQHKALTTRLKDVFARPAAAPAAADARRPLGPSKVGKRAAKVFRALFYDAVAVAADPAAAKNAASYTPAEVAWPDAVHALRAAGFDAARLYGSAWLFTPARSLPRGHHLTAAGRHNLPQRPFLAHEPWTPSNKLTPVAARWLGKRLHRAYGWNAATFVAE